MLSACRGGLVCPTHKNGESGERHSGIQVHAHTVLATYLLVWDSACCSMIPAHTGCMECIGNQRSSVGNACINFNTISFHVLKLNVRMCSPRIMP